MIVIECIFGVLKNLLRFCIWLITARDCKHCKYGTFTKWGWLCSMKDLEKEKKCKNTLRRCCFEKKKGGEG